MSTLLIYYLHIEFCISHNYPANKPLAVENLLLDAKKTGTPVQLKNNNFKVVYDSVVIAVYKNITKDSKRSGGSWSNGVSTYLHSQPLLVDLE